MGQKKYFRKSRLRISHDYGRHNVQTPNIQQMMGRKDTNNYGSPKKGGKIMKVPRKIDI